MRSPSRKAWISSGLTAVSPSGFRKSDAIFATSLFGPMPIEQVSPSRSRIASFSARACASPSSIPPRDDRSMYASSMLASSNASAPSPMIAMIRPDTSR